MAADKEINIDIIINTAKSAKNLTDIKKSMEDIKKAQKDISKESIADQKKLADALADTALASANAATTFRDQRQALKDLKDAMEAVGPEDKQFIKLTAAAGQLEHKMKAVGDAIKYTSGTPIHNLSAGFKGIEESLLTGNFEEMEIALKSMGNSMMQLAKGALKNLADRFTAFGKGTSGVVKGLGKAFSGDLKGGLKAAGDGFKDLGQALKVNPIFLIVGIVALIIDKFNELKNAGGLIGKVFKAIGDAIGAVIKFFKDLSDAIGLTNNAAQEAAESLLALHKQEAEEGAKGYERAQKQMEAEAELAKAKTKNKVEELKLAKKTNGDLYQLELAKLLFAKMSAQHQIDDIEKIRQASGNLSDEQKKDLEDLKNQLKDTDADINAATLKYQAEQIKTDKEISDAQEEANKKKVEDNKKANEKIKANTTKAYEDLKKEGENRVKETKEHTQQRVDTENDALTDQLAFLQANYKKMGLSDQEYADQKQAILDQEQTNQQAYYDWLQEQSDKEDKDNIAANKADEDELKQELADQLSQLQDAADAKILLAGDNKTKQLQIQAELLQQEYAAEIANANITGADTSKITAKYNKLILKNTQELNKSLKEDKQQLSDAEVGLAQTTTDAISGLGDLMLSNNKANAKEQFELNKAISISSALISGYEGIVNALSAKSILPEPFATIAKIANVAALGASTAANIAKIRATQFSSAGGGSSSSNSNTSTGGNSGVLTTYNQNPNPQGLQSIGGSSGFNNPTNPQSGNSTSGKPEPQKVYVVAQDITNAQNKNAVLSRRARFS